ncbi:MAG: hypothetical protein JJD92_07150 [Frankiaceae bacterium]|nr:hypothetical protein [Frankiaceae bacterium]
MEHVVFFPAHDGSPAFRRVANLEDAVRLVEHLRNVEGVNEVSCHALTEVPLAFRTYYRVEVPGAVEAPEVVDTPVEASVEAPPPEVVAEEPQAELSVLADAVSAAPVEVAEHADEPVMVSANGRTNDGAKSLGFFA